MRVVMRTRWILILLAIFASFSGARSDASDIDSALEAYLAEDYDRALEMFSTLGAPGRTDSWQSAFAQYFLGEMSYYGYGIPQDYSEALRWYQLSAAQGDADAEHSIGYMHEQGEGVPVNYEEALLWYSKAADQGQTDAQVSLANMYLEGRGVERNITEAIVWLRTAGELNNVDAQRQLGELYELNDEVGVDLNEAMKWYTYAVAQYDVESLIAKKRIQARPDYREDYPRFLRSFGLTKSDADALFCENFLWNTTFDLKLQAHDTLDTRVSSFADNVFKRIADFRNGLNKKLKKEQYDETPWFRETIKELEDIDAVWRADLEARGERLTLAERLILAREEGGIFELAYHSVFLEHFEELSHEETRGLWDYCTTKYTAPGGWFTADISLDALDKAMNYEPMVERIYYSALDYGVGMIDWSRTKFRRIQSIDVCRGDLDLAGGIAIGTAGTSLMAGESILMIITSSGVFVATAPAIATGVTVTAIAGATVYAGARGYCYFFKGADDDVIEGSAP